MNIADFIVDFYRLKAKLAIELDGFRHFTEDGIAHDNARTGILTSLGIEVLRFSNSDVDKNFTGVCAKIDETVRQRVSLGSPLAKELSSADG